MRTFLIDKKEINRQITEAKFLKEYSNAKFVIDIQDKNVFSLKNSVMTVGEIDYIVDLTIVFKNMNLYIIEFWLPSLNMTTDRQLVKSEYLKLKDKLLALDTDILNNVRLHLDGSSIANIHLISTLN